MCSEETSNNRVRSGANPRPIDFVPHAGSRRGTADGIETTEGGVGTADLESGEGSPPVFPPTPSTAGPTPNRAGSLDTSIPHLQV